MDNELESLAQTGEPDDISKRAKLAKMMKSMGRHKEPVDGQLENSGELDDTSKRAKIAMKMIKTMGLNQEMIRSIVTSWLVPQFKPEIIAEYSQHLAKIHDVGFLGVSNSSIEVSRPFRMFDITDGMLVDDIDSSAPYCMVSHRWKDLEINLDMLQRVKKKVSRDYPTWYNTDRTDVEMILKYCKEKIMKQRRKVNGCAVKNRLDENLAQNDCYVLSLLRMYHRSKQIRKEVKDAHMHLEKMIHDKKVTDMESRVFKDLSNKAKSSIDDDDGIRASLANPEEQQPAVDDVDDDTDAVKAAYERIFDAEWERDKHSDDAKFDNLSRDLRDMVEKMIRCLRLWRSAIKIEQSILKAEKIFKRGLVPGYKHQQKFYVWLDTCCIDKSNHNEYSESMSLMGDWYAQSAFTLVHLDTGFDRIPEKSDAEIYWDEYLQTDGDYHKLETIADRRIDPIQKYEDIAKEPEIEWSTRGWTLQELVMSRMTYYVNADWKLLSRPVENLGRAYHLIPHMGLYTNLLDVKPTPNAWKPEILMTALLNCGAIQYTEAIKAVYPRIEQESEEEEVEEGFSLSNALLASIAMPWNIMDTVFHVAKPEPAKDKPDEKTKVKLSGEALLRETSVLWDQNLASQFPHIEEEEKKKKQKQKSFKINEHLRLEDSFTSEDKVSHALSIIKALELVGLCFPKDITPETAKTEIAQAVFFATMALVECYEQTKYPMVIREVSTQENGGKQSDSEQKAILKQKREIEKRVKLEVRKRLFQELLDSFPEAKEQYSIESIESFEDKEEAVAKTFAHILHVLVDEVNTLILDDRQYIAEFGKITLLDSWVDGTRRHGFTTQEVMTLACQRRTTKSFDRAYSLMGILGVRFPTFPAEGYEKALCRLFDETLTTHNDVSVFNWAGFNRGSSIRGRSMYPSTQEAYQAKDSRLYSRNSMAETEKDKMLQTTSYYHAIVSLLRDLIEFMKKSVPPKQVVEWIGYISAIIYSFDLGRLNAATASAERVEKSSGRSNFSNGTSTLPYEIEVLSKFIGLIINGPSQTRPGPQRLLSSNAIRNPRFEVDIDPEVQIVVDPPLQAPDVNGEHLGCDPNPNGGQNTCDTENISPPEPADVALLTEDAEDESPPVGRKSRFVEQLSEVGSAPVPPMMGDNGASQTGSNVPLSENEEISRYLQSWVGNSQRWAIKDSQFFETPLPAKVQGIRHKIEKEDRESGNYKTASFGSPNMVSPHPIIVTNAGIESIFDIQRVIITMADLEGLRQQVEHATSPDQIISGYCSISTGFAQVIVQFSCKSEMLRKQLEVIDGIDFRVMKEQNKKEDKKREHKMTSKVLFEKKKKDKKSREEKKKKKKDKREDAEPDQPVSVNNEVNNNDDETVIEASGEPQARDLDEEKTINRMIKFIQEDDLRLVAGEWVLARCSGVANADWFLCHLEIGSTHPFYGYRIPTSEIDFDNCFPEDGLVTEWNRYMNRKKEEMCKILATFLKSKEHKLKRRRLVGRILRDLAPLDEKAEEELPETPRSSLERNSDTNGYEMNGANGEGRRSETHEEQANPIQHEYDYLDDFAETRNDEFRDDAGREPQPFSETFSQDSMTSVQHDDVWSALPDPNSQYSTTSVEAQDRWGNQELRPEDSVSNYGDRDSRPSQQPPTPSFDDMTVVGRNSIVEAEAEAGAEAGAEEKSKIWDYLPLIEKVAEKTAKHYDKHLSATVLKDTPTVLRQAIENLNDNRDFLPAMFHSAKKIHMF